MLACSFGASDLCPDNAWLAGPLAQRGAQSQIAYVRFEGDDVEDWLESIGFIIP